MALENECIPNWSHDGFHGLGFSQLKDYCYTYHDGDGDCGASRFFQGSPGNGAFTNKRRLRGCVNANCVAMLVIMPGGDLLVLQGVDARGHGWQRTRVTIFLICLTCPSGVASNCTSVIVVSEKKTLVVVEHFYLALEDF